MQQQKKPTSIALPQLLSMMEESLRVQVNLFEEIRHIFLGPRTYGPKLYPAEEQRKARVKFNDARHVADRERKRGWRKGNHGGGNRRRVSPQKDGPFSKVARQKRHVELDNQLAKLPAIIRLEDVPDQKYRGVWIARQVRAGRIRRLADGTYKNKLAA